MALNLTLPAAGADENVWGGVLNAYLTGLNQGKADQTTVDQLQTSVSSSLSQRVTNTIFAQYQADQAVAVAALVPKTDYETYKAQVSTSLQAKSNVDHTHDTSSITTGVVDPARLGLGAQNQIAARNSAGILAPVTYTGFATANTLAYRGDGGTLQIGTPTLVSHATTKAYVDAAVASAAGTPTTDASKLTSGLLSPERIGIPNLSAAIIPVVINGQWSGFEASFSPTAGTIVTRNGTGFFDVKTPTASTHPTTKAYVDNAVATIAAVSPVRVWNTATRTWPAVGATTDPVMFISTNDKTAPAPTNARVEFDVWIPHVDAVNV